LGQADKISSDDGPVMRVGKHNWAGAIKTSEKYGAAVVEKSCCAGYAEDQKGDVDLGRQLLVRLHVFFPWRYFIYA